MQHSFFALALLAFASPVLAGPFGIDQGERVSRLKVITKTGSKIFRIDVPEPNSNFVSYGVVATPIHGVCAVFGETEAFPNWNEAKAKRDALVKLLSKYGKPVRVKTDGSYETLASRSPKDAYDLEWRKIRAPLSTVSLNVFGTPKGQIVRIAYYFRNMELCNNWEPKQDLRGL